jgi:hypothetical protein
MTVWCEISTLELYGLHWCNPFAFNWNAEKKHTDAILRVLEQCPVFTHLDLGLNRMGPRGTESLVPVLGQCATLTHLNLSGNLIGPKGARSLGRVLGHDRLMPFFGCDEERCGPILFLSINVTETFNQLLRDGRMVISVREEERSGPSLYLNLNVTASFNQLLRDGSMSIMCRDDERRRSCLWLTYVDVC